MIELQQKSPFLFVLLLLFVFPGSFSAHSQERRTVWEVADGAFYFRWDLITDRASLHVDGKKGAAWTGSLLPAFWLKDSTGIHYVHATFEERTAVDGIGAAGPGAGGVPGGKDAAIVLPLRLGDRGHGTLTVEKRSWGICFVNLHIQWEGEVPAIVEMYFGTSIPPEGTENILMGERPFLPDWQAAGYCVPGAKEGVAQSYFRSWDFGQADIALGNFGPSMGSPYGAAYPRPLLFAGMGNEAGWICFGAGSIPDAALSLKIQSTRGCFKYVYREDKWGAPKERGREWADLLRISFDRSAYDAFAKYYSSFSGAADTSGRPERFSVIPRRLTLPAAASWNTWGMWKQGFYGMSSLTDFAAQAGAGILVFDGGWESSEGSGRPSPGHLPHFTADVARARERGLSIGFWESLAWLNDTVAARLGSADLIVDGKGRPVRTNWNFDPREEAYYCLDISSAPARSFLQERTTRLMKEWKPRLIKLDFGYALPHPDMGVPRDPALRGERYCYALIRLIAEAARKVDPDVLIMYYGISPLYLPLVDIVSLDDQGDLWYAIASGHAEWSIWASLAGKQGTGLSGSSTYSWGDDRNILLNTAVLGVPGAVLPVIGEGDKEIPPGFVNRRLALNRWYRKTTLWQPRWYNSYQGGLDRPPELKCWGREEWIAGKNCLTALALRQDADTGLSIERIHWSGDWAIIAQDNREIRESEELALIPFTKGRLTLPLAKRPARVERMNTTGTYLFQGWTWANGRLTITVSSHLLNETAGFIVLGR